MTHFKKVSTAKTIIMICFKLWVRDIVRYKAVLHEITSLIFHDSRLTICKELNVFLDHHVMKFTEYINKFITIPTTHELKHRGCDKS